MEDRYFNNHVKTMLKKKDKVSAAWIHSMNPTCTSIIANAGFDVVMIDLEHSPAAFPELLSMVQATQGTEALPFARAPWNDMVSLKKMLDCGVYGVSIPFVCTKEEAELAVKSCKYPSKGIRGTAGCHYAAQYGLKRNEYFQAANDEIVVMVAIETKEAADNINEILEVQDLDGIFIGPADLGASMGFFGNHTSEVDQVIRGIEEKVLQTNKFLATVANGVEHAKQLYNRGYSFVVMMSDMVDLAKYSHQMVNEFKNTYRSK